MINVGGQLIVGGVTPWQVVLVHIGKQAEKNWRNKAVNGALPWLSLQVLTPALTSVSDKM